jgi:anti-anti-sigma factor
MKQEIQIDRDVATVRLAGKLMGGPSSGQLHAETKKLLDDGVRRFIVDMEKVQWINSAGLGILVALYVAITSKGGEMVLLNASERVVNILRVTKLESIFQLSETRAD